jgi:hypothetical protein
MWRLMALPILLIVVVLAGDRALERKAWAAEAIELSQDDRAALEKFLGKGVVGKAVPGNPIADATKFF